MWSVSTEKHALAGLRSPKGLMDLGMYVRKLMVCIYCIWIFRTYDRTGQFENRRFVHCTVLLSTVAGPSWVVV
jgi:hypothetical protein